MSRSDKQFGQESLEQYIYDEGRELASFEIHVSRSRLDKSHLELRELFVPYDIHVHINISVINLIFNRALGTYMLLGP